jgi:hypothetical protein
MLGAMHLQAVSERETIAGKISDESLDRWSLLFFDWLADTQQPGDAEELLAPLKKFKKSFGVAVESSSSAIDPKHQHLSVRPFPHNSGKYIGSTTLLVTSQKATPNELKSPAPASDSSRWYPT